MNMFESFEVKDNGIWIPKSELERLRNHYFTKSSRQLQLSMYNDMMKSLGKRELIENLIGLIEEY